MFLASRITLLINLQHLKYNSFIAFYYDIMTVPAIYTNSLCNPTILVWVYTCIFYWKTSFKDI
jgi:hypothetical protein